MAGTYVPSTPADGNVKTVLVPAIANISAPTVAELNAAAAIDISCYLIPGGYNIQRSQETIADDRECDTTNRTVLGRISPTLDITGIDNTNATDGATPAVPAPNDLAAALIYGSTWFGVRRRGVAFDQPFKAGEVVEITQFTVGLRNSVQVAKNTNLQSVWQTAVQADTSTAVVVAGAGS